MCCSDALSRSIRHDMRMRHHSCFALGVVDFHADVAFSSRAFLLCRLCLTLTLARPAPRPPRDALRPPIVLAHPPSLHSKSGLTRPSSCACRSQLASVPSINWWNPLTGTCDEKFDDAPYMAWERDLSSDCCAGGNAELPYLLNWALVGGRGRAAKAAARSEARPRGFWRRSCALASPSRRTPSSSLTRERAVPQRWNK